MTLSDAGSTIGGAFLFLFLFGALMYFLPTFIALIRHHPTPGPTIVINIFLGWTFLGWVIALAMAFGGQRYEYEEDDDDDAEYVSEHDFQAGRRRGLLIVGGSTLCLVAVVLLVNLTR